MYLDIRHNIRLILDGTVKGIVLKEPDDTVLFAPVLKNTNTDYTLINNVIISNIWLNKYSSYAGPLRDNKIFVSHKDQDVSPEIMLPHNFYSYKVQALMPESDRFGYYIEVPGNKNETPFEIIAQHYKYRFDKETKKIIKLDRSDVLRNLTRRYINNFIQSNSGIFSIEDKLADYGKLLSFLVNKCKDLLTAGEKNALNPFIVREITLKELTVLGGREAKLLNILQKFKSGELRLFGGYNFYE